VKRMTFMEMKKEKRMIMKMKILIVLFKELKKKNKNY